MHGITTIFEGRVPTPSIKWIEKYMLMAKVLADTNSACLSRKIGVVLTNPEHRIISTGYNGSPPGVPHNDSFAYLYALYTQILPPKFRQQINTKYGFKQAEDTPLADAIVDNGSKFAFKFANSGQCPRKILNIPSGQHLEFCNCGHAERNALANANRLGVSTIDSIMYCWCGVPCHECVIQIIQAGVGCVICLETSTPDYSPSSRYNLCASQVTLVQVPIVTLTCENTDK